MKRLAIALVCAFSLTVSSRAEPPSDASVKELLTLVEAQKMVDSMFGQMKGMMDSSMKQATQGKTLTKDETAAQEKLESKMLDLMKEELSWAKLEDLYLKVYRESFTQEEVNGVIAFYKSPAGQAYVKKMPVVMQKTMTEMQQRMGPMMQKIQAMTQDAVKDSKK
jgi:hypothetical protein